MKIFVTGGCGYKGSVLVNKLLKRGDEVTVFDIMWFGNYLKPHPKLTVIQGDIRNLEELPDNYEAVIHLAAVANDPCADLNPKLSWEINALASMRLAAMSCRAHVNQFIYASSGSVYGVSDALQVTENTKLVPISEYNKTKMVAERAVLSYHNCMAMGVTVLRPATVCGVSPRMRFDVMVNMFVAQAMENKKITVFGGSQMRPTVHIDTITDAYIWCLDYPYSAADKIFNVGFENVTALEVAKSIRDYIGEDINIEISESNDPRSYRLCSDRIMRAGFAPKSNMKIAIADLVENFKLGNLKRELRNLNVEWMKQCEIK